MQWVQWGALEGWVVMGILALYGVAGCDKLNNLGIEGGSFLFVVFNALALLRRPVSIGTVAEFKPILFKSPEKK